MDRLANIITDYYIKKAYVPESKREIYSYGFKLIIADVINFSMVILLGTVIGRFIESVIFLITLCGVRQFSGGFHAKTFWLCRVSMLVTFLCVMMLSYLLSESTLCNSRTISIINFISLIFIALLSPVKHPNKVLTVSQRRSNKIKAIIASFILSSLSIALVIADRVEGVTISITLTAVVVLMITGIAAQKGGKRNV